MMRYLDNNRSNKRNVNENYGRELLELHTVGLDGRIHRGRCTPERVHHDRPYGRQQRRLRLQRRTATGPARSRCWTSPTPTDPRPRAWRSATSTSPTSRPIRPRRKRIAHKLARRFVCDDPPQTLVDRLAQSYLDNGTAIVPVLRTLFSSVEFWMSTGLKARTPAGERASPPPASSASRPGANTTEGLDGLYRMTDNLGQAPLTWGPPDGFPDYADAWGSAHATLGTWNSHRSMIAGLGARG